MIENTPDAWSERAETVQSAAAATLWSVRSQAARHKAAVAMLDPQAGDSLLDFGCGTGALTERLPAGVSYFGYDWAPGMLDRARREHPGWQFGNMLPFGRHFDLTCAIGPFNLPDRWSKDHTWAAIGRIWAKTLQTMLISLYCGDDESCIRYTEREVTRFGWTLGRTTTWQPLPNDLMLVVRR